MLVGSPAVRQLPRLSYSKRLRRGGRVGAGTETVAAIDPARWHSRFKPESCSKGIQQNQGPNSSNVFCSTASFQDYSRNVAFPVNCPTGGQGGGELPQTPFHGKFGVEYGSALPRIKDNKTIGVADE